MSDRKYAEGEKEPTICGWCGSPINLVFHGPKANHTTEPILSPLSDEEKRVYQEARKSIVEARR